MSDIKKMKSKINISNIKSSYILMEIFSYINKKRIYNIIIYNKTLQNRILIDIEDYKKISGKYKIGKKNGHGKEYKLDNTNLLIFEGQYLNGKRNGKGKEYDDNYGYILYEGEYLKGKRSGKGKEFNENGKLVYEGEYLNGERNGKGIEYSDHKDYGNRPNRSKKEEENLYLYGVDKTFEGEYKDGKRNGKGKEYNDCFGLVFFEGEYLNGERKKEKNIVDIIVIID